MTKISALHGRWSEDAATLGRVQGSARVAVPREAAVISLRRSCLRAPVPRAIRSQRNRARYRTRCGSQGLGSRAFHEPRCRLPDLRARVTTDASSFGLDCRLRRLKSATNPHHGGADTIRTAREHQPVADEPFPSVDSEQRRLLCDLRVVATIDRRVVVFQFRVFLLIPKSAKQGRVLLPVLETRHRGSIVGKLGVVQGVQRPVGGTVAKAAGQEDREQRPHNPDPPPTIVQPTSNGSRCRFRRYCGFENAHGSLYRPLAASRLDRAESFFSHWTPRKGRTPPRLNGLTRRRHSPSGWAEPLCDPGRTQAAAAGPHTLTNCLCAGDQATQPGPSADPDSPHETGGDRRVRADGFDCSPVTAALVERSVGGTAGGSSPAVPRNATRRFTREQLALAVYAEVQGTRHSDDNAR
jgi:hypothetical protein